MQQISVHLRCDRKWKISFELAYQNQVGLVKILSRNGTSVLVYRSMGDNPVATLIATVEDEDCCAILIKGRHGPELQRRLSGNRMN